MATLRDYNLDDEMPSGGPGGTVSWGDIDGTLAAQTDLQAALDAKADVGEGGGTFPHGGGYALRFLGSGAHPTYDGHHVNHGHFYDPDDLDSTTGIFLWEAWVMPLSSANYWFSDGWGGGHKFLAGFDAAASGPLGLTGNIWNAAGAATQSFQSVDKVQPGTLHHVLHVWDGTQIVTFLDGVISGNTAYTGNRGNNGSTGIAFIGGSDHSNFIGWIFRIRGFEGVLPFSGGSIPAGILHPEKTFRAAFRKSSDGSTLKAAAVWDYTTPARIIPDLSAGYNGTTHPGVLSAGSDDGVYQEARKDTADEYLPEFEVKPFEQTAYAGAAPTATPGTALLFDEFRRQDSVPAWDLNPTTAGRTTPTGQLWSANMGVLSEKLFPWANGTVDVAVDHGSADVDITFTNGSTTVFPDVYIRRNGTVASPGTTYLAVSMVNLGGPMKVRLSEVVAGSGSTIADSVDVGAMTWSTLRIVANGTSVDVYRDEVLRITAATVSVTTGTIAALTLNPLARLDKIEAYPA